MNVFSAMCKLPEAHHGLVAKFKAEFPHDRSDRSTVLFSSQLQALADGRREVVDEEESSDGGQKADDGIGWLGTGSVGSGYTIREACDGQALASPGRHVPDTT